MAERLRGTLTPGYGDGSGYGYGSRDGYGSVIAEVGGYKMLARPGPWQLIGVGCHVHTLPHWREHWREIANAEGVRIDDAEAQQLLSLAERAVAGP